tara:strand:- start:758 stop:1660 length:903 start_codon:yes stop_codon:yes gene_type:complete
MQITKEKIIFFTIATHKNHHVERLLASAKKHNIKLHIFGLGEEYKGNGKKRILMHRFLQSCPEDAIFLFVDAFDVIFLANEEEIFNKYRSHYKDELVFGGEQNLGMYTFDDVIQFFKYPLKKTRFKYLNSGTIMGPVYKAINLFEEVGLDCHKQVMDQPDLIRHFVKNPQDLTIDSQHHLFGVNGGRAGLETKDYQLRNNRLYSTHTDTWPVLFHVPGKFFIGLDEFSHKLGFMDKIPTYTKKELKSYNSSKVEHKICDFLSIENYLYRIVKNYSVIFFIITFVVYFYFLILSILQNLSL